MPNLHVETGSFKVIEEVTGKSVECVTDGYCSFPQPHAFGQWDFQWYMHDRGYLSFITLANDNYTTSSGYILYADQGGSWLLRRYTAGGAATVFSGSGDFNVDAWNDVRITRSLDGEFKMYVNGSLVGTATNTDHTTSAFAVMDMDAGDRIRNFRHSLGVLE